MTGSNKFHVGQTVSHKDMPDLRFRVIEILLPAKEDGECAYDCQLIDGNHSQSPPVGWMVAEQIAGRMAIEQMIRETNAELGKEIFKFVQIRNTYSEKSLFSID